MALTRKLLKELELPDTAIERIIAAHSETVNALKADRDAALTAAAALEATSAERDELRQTTARQQEAHEQLRSEYDAYRLQVHQERHAAQRQAALQDALRRAGANEHALPLLASAIHTCEEDWDGDILRDEQTLLAPVITQHNAFFSQPRPLGTDPIAPPLGGGVLTPADIRCMSAEEINRNWSAISTALMQRT